MSPEQFCYWFQGFVELNGSIPNQQQWDSIVEHLGTVFNKITTETSTKIPQEVIDKFVETVHTAENHNSLFC